MYIVIFDIDGTLTNTRHLDEASYTRALKEVFKIEIPLHDRTGFKASADSGLLGDLYYFYKCKNINNSEIELFKERFIHNLEGELRKSTDLLIKGAAHVINVLRIKPDIKLAFATGAWLESAKLKLSYAGINYEGIEISSANDGLDKAEILEFSFKLLKYQLYPKIHSKAYYVGDRHWDFYAAQKMNMGFIGIGNDKELHANVPKRFILNDLSNVNKFEQLIYE